MEAQLAADIAASRRIYDAFIECDMLDDDGYPTEEALQIVESDIYWQNGIWNDYEIHEWIQVY
jgi:hypothetical protein